MNHRLVVAAVRDFLAKQRVDHKVPVATLAVVWKFNLLSVTTWPKTRITLTPAGEDYFAAFE